MGGEGLSHKETEEGICDGWVNAIKGRKEKEVCQKELECRVGEEGQVFDVRVVCWGQTSVSLEYQDFGIKRGLFREFPGAPAVRTLHFVKVEVGQWGHISRDGGPSEAISVLYGKEE